MTFLKRENVYYCYLSYNSSGNPFRVRLVCYGETPFELHTNFGRIGKITVDETVLDFDKLKTVDNKNVKEYVTDRLFCLTELD